MYLGFYISFFLSSFHCLFLVSPCHWLVLSVRRCRIYTLLQIFVSRPTYEGHVLLSKLFICLVFFSVYGLGLVLDSWEESGRALHIPRWGLSFGLL